MCDDGNGKTFPSTPLKIEIRKLKNASKITNSTCTSKSSSYIRKFTKQI